MAETDPKTVQDLTNVVQTLLQQMQDKFQTMSDQIIGRNILTILMNRALSFKSTKYFSF
uniref:Heat shock factor-binding protein 1 n=1 Tax=Nothobranchius furzeri TaxID=105023 RepID=A0A8C6PZD8_NOTFU